MSVNPSSRHDYYGNGSVFITDYGSMDTDEDGVTTCNAEFKVKAEKWGQLPVRGFQHPLWLFLILKKRKVKISDGWAIATCEFEGANPGDFTFADQTKPVYELNVGVGEEPIATHPDFEKFAGTPTAPKHGARFEDSEGEKVTAAKPSTTGNDGYVFDAFDMSDKNFAKMDAYLDVDITWSKTWIQSTMPTSSKAGMIDTAPGAPALSAGRKWLNMGISATTVGRAFRCRESWRSSGRKGWNTDVYK